MKQKTSEHNMEKLAAHFLFPSTIFVSEKPHLVTTVLGSCVAVCLWSSVLKIGGMNHFMLPLWNGEGLASPKYGNIAIKKLINRMEGLGAKREDLIAKVFGGAEQLPFIKNSFHIGQRNIEQAKETLKEEGIKVVSHHLGGNSGRHIKFRTDTGQVLLRKVQKIDLDCQLLIEPND